MPGAQTWSIVILCYNERAAIQRVTEKTMSVLDRLCDAGEGEILLIDDGSRDGSAELVQRLARTHARVRAIAHPKNRGFGHALRTGYAAALGENVCAIPGDDQFDPEELIPFATLAPLTFVSFTRRRQAGYSLLRRFVSAFNRWVNEWLLGFAVRDVNWVKAYKRGELLAIEPKLTSMLLNSEITAKLLLSGARCLEPWSTYRPRHGGKSHGASPRHLFGAITELARLARELIGFRQRQRLTSLTQLVSSKS